MRIIEGLLGARGILRSDRKEDLMAKENTNGEIVIEPNDAALIFEEGGDLFLVFAGSPGLSPTRSPDK